MRYIIFSIIVFVALNANEQNTEQTQEMQSLESIISLPPLILDSIEDEEKKNSDENHSNHDHESKKEYDFDLHIGVFNKTNLGKTKDNYNAFSASLNLAYSLQNTLFFGLGVNAITPLYEYPKYNAINNYIDTRFLASTAYIKYKVADFFVITGGRYHEHKDWLRHYVQGIGIDVEYDLFEVWANWVDEQAHANREHMSDFNTYKNAYNNEFLWATGININIPYLSIAPYYYALNKFFWSVGGKLESKLIQKEGFGYATTLHYAYLKSKKNEYSHDHNHMHSNLEGDSSILWFDQEVNYSFQNGSLSFGAGYIQVWKSYFELANIGNISRFETHSHNAYEVIEPGGMNNGINTSNMFNANTRTFYGFVGTEINKVALMALFRNSKGSGITQDSYSLGFRWNVALGVNIGGIGAYMIENKKNLSFLKGYIEFKI